MRIARRVVEHTFQFAHHCVAKDMLDLLSIIMHVVRRNIGGVCQIKLPEPVVADDCAAHGGVAEQWAKQWAEQRRAGRIPMRHFFGRTKKGPLWDPPCSALDGAGETPAPYVTANDL